MSDFTLCITLYHFCFLSGIAVIINNVEFDKKYTKREGSDEDAGYNSFNFRFLY